MIGLRREGLTVYRRPNNARECSARGRLSRQPNYRILSPHACCILPALDGSLIGDRIAVGGI